MSLPAWKVVALLGLVPAVAVGQTQRTMESSRPFRGERELSVCLECSQGGFEVRPAGRDTLYATQFAQLAVTSSVGAASVRWVGAEP